MNIFEAVKQSVTTRQAAESYGIRVNKNGMAVCPFHRDKNPSMKVERRQRNWQEIFLYIMRTWGTARHRENKSNDS